MARAHTEMPFDAVTGKFNKKSSQYFYRNSKSGAIYSRQRLETYQQRNTPKRKWVREAFAFAQKEYKNQIIADGCHALGYDLPSEENKLSKSQLEEVLKKGNELLEQAYLASDKRDPFGKTVFTARAWKFRQLIAQWKTDNPIESWYESYKAQLDTQTENLKNAEKPSNYKIDQLIAQHEAEIAALKALKREE